MDLRQSLKIEEKQKLLLTTQMRQSLRILQMNITELQTYLSKQLVENCVLEIEPGGEELNLIHEEDRENRWLEPKESEEYWEGTEPGHAPAESVSHRWENAGRASWNSAEQQTLQEHLISQLHLITSTPLELFIGEFLIGCLDEDGYLRFTPEELTKAIKDLGIPGLEKEVNLAEVRKVLKMVQSLDPPGVGARNLAECLQLQISLHLFPPEEEQVRKLALQIVKGFLPDVAAGRLPRVAKSLNTRVSDIQKVVDFIRRLEPRPGRTFGNVNPGSLIPDVTIKVIDSDFFILVNDIAGCRLRINPYYRSLVNDSSCNRRAADYIKEKIASATWLIKSVESRRRTLYKITEFLVDWDRDFFVKGQKHLKPLTMSEVAEAVGVHEATVSRAVRGKHIQTPAGLFSFRYFFDHGVSGEEVTSSQIKSQIKEIIAAEDRKKPFSDQKLADLLKKRGINISRRTVAKYREEIRIPPSNMRRRF